MWPEGFISPFRGVIRKPTLIESKLSVNCIAIPPFLAAAVYRSHDESSYFLIAPPTMAGIEGKMPIVLPQGVTRGDGTIQSSATEAASRAG